MPRARPTQSLLLLTCLSGQALQSPCGLERVLQSFQAADRDANHRIGLDEAVHAKIPAHDFSLQDYDHDLQLERAEFVLYYRSLLLRAGRRVGSDLELEAARIQASRQLRAMRQPGSLETAGQGARARVQAGPGAGRARQAEARAQEREPHLTAPQALQSGGHSGQGTRSLGRATSWLGRLKQSGPIDPSVAADLTLLLQATEATQQVSASEWRGVLAALERARGWMAERCAQGCLEQQSAAELDRQLLQGARALLGQTKPASSEDLAHLEAIRRKYERRAAPVAPAQLASDRDRPNEPESAAPQPSKLDAAGEERVGFSPEGALWDGAREAARQEVSSHEDER